MKKTDLKELDERLSRLAAPETWLGLLEALLKFARDWDKFWEGEAESIHKSRKQVETEINSIERLKSGRSLTPPERKRLRELNRRIVEIIFIWNNGRPVLELNEILGKIHRFSDHDLIADIFKSHREAVSASRPLRRIGRRPTKRDQTAGLMRYEINLGWITIDEIESLSSKGRADLYGAGRETADAALKEVAFGYPRETRLANSVGRAATGADRDEPARRVRRLRVEHRHDYGFRRQATEPRSSSAAHSLKAHLKQAES